MFLLSLFFYFSFLISSLHSHSVIINLNSDSGRTNAFHELQFPVCINEVKLFSDVAFDEAERKELINFEPGLIQLQDLETLIENLKMKNKFETVSFFFKPIEETKFDLILKIKSLWTFDNVRIKGRIRHKEKYLRNYHFEVGESFDENKHKHFISKITKDLHAEGFLSARIVDNIQYNEKTKSVFVKLNLENLERFVINDIQLVIKTKKITDEFDNLKKNLESTFLNVLKKNFYNKKLVNDHVEVLKKYLAKKGYLFNKIKIIKNINSNNKIALTFEIDLQNKRKLVFFGNHFLSSNQLLERMLYFGDSLLLISSELLAQEIVNLYHNFGFWSVKVDIKEEEGKIYFLINEGKRAEIKKINIQGINKFTEKEIIDLHFNSILENKFYDIDILKQIYNKILLWYLQKGFWEFEIIKQDFKQTGSEQEYELELVFNEGNPKYLKKVEVENFTNLIQYDVFRKLSLEKGPIPFNTEILKEQKDWLINHFRSKGYLYIDIEYAIKEEQDGSILTWKVKGDLQQVKFGKTFISASSQLPSDILLRELSYRENQIFDRKKIDESLKKLRNLTIFDQINLSVVNDQDKYKKNILIKYNLDDPFELRTKAGFLAVSKNFSFKGGLTYALGASFIWKNPFNYADIIKIILEANKYKSNICLCYEIPWFLYVPVRTAFKTYSIRYEQPIVIGSTKNLYKAFQDGILINCTKKMNHYDLALTFGFEAMKIDSLQHDLARLIDFQARLVGKRVPYVFFESTIFCDFIDDKVDPRKGSLTLFSCKGMFPFNLPDGYFIKFLFEQSFFYPIWESVVCAFRFRFGHIFNPNFKNLMPIERFYLGGPYSIRGYEPDQVPPVNFLPKDEKNSCCLVPTGGKTMVNINCELRFPLYEKINGVLFNDMGVLAGQKITDILGNNWVGATGFGLRYTTPVGPLRFDIGWKWKKRFPQDKSYCWTLTLGQAF